MTTAQAMTVVASDTASATIASSSGCTPVIRHPTPKSLQRATNVFVLSSATELPNVTEFVRQANRLHKLRALLVRSDVNLPSLGQMLNRANVRTLRNLMVHSTDALPRRVLFAWRIGAQDKLIADANVVDDRLLMLSCANEQLDLPFDAIPDLKKIPEDQRKNFEIAEDGSCVHWPRYDLHLDLDAVRFATDPAWRERVAAESAAYDRRFGAAGAALRKEHGLRQSDVPGRSTRQVGRIENGSRPRLATLKELAKSHGMDLNDYLAALAKKTRKLPRPA